MCIRDRDYCSCYGGSVPVSGFQASLRCNINYNGAIWVNTAGERVFKMCIRDRCS